MTELLDRLLRHRRNDLLVRAAAGEEAASFQLFSLPWSLDGLGPSLDDPEILGRIERTFLGPAGNPVAFAEGVEVKWIETASELETAFLAFVRDTNGRSWTDFEEQADAIWCSIAALACEDDECADGLAECLAERFQVVRQTEESTLASLDLAWGDAFATGRVLVFERINEEWRFGAPGQWKSKPPLAAIAPRLALDAVTRNYRKLRKQLSSSLPEADTPAALAPFGSIARAVNIFGDFPKSLLPASYPIPAADLPGVLAQGPDGPAKRPTQRLYLVSGHLSEKMRGPTSFKGVGPRSKEIARLEKALRAWFRTEVVPQRRMTREAAWAVIENEARARTGIADGWGRMAKRIWDQCAPPDWHRAGRPVRTPTD